MRNTLYVLVLLFSLQFNPVTGLEVRVAGTAPTYAGMDLVFMKYADFITHEEVMVGVCHVADNGEFSLTLDLTETTMLFTYIGVYRAYFYAEPGGQYDLILPEFKEKTLQEKLNPYFQYVDLHLGMKYFSEDELNILIMMFDDAYYPYYSKHVNDVYERPDISVLERDISQIEVPFSTYQNKFFRDYRTYVYGLLKMFAQQQRVQSLSDEYFNNLPVLYSHPIYGELFNQVFDKYFVFFGRSTEGREIYRDINELGSYDALLRTVSESSNFSNDTLSELVILKELHDEYYGDQFSRAALLNILDSLIEKSEIEDHKIIGSHIRDKITRLQSGFEPPDLDLLDADSNLVELSDFTGKYVYLNFCTLQSYTCLNEFNLLADLYNQYSDYLVIVTVTNDPDGEEYRQFLKKYHYNWVFLQYDNNPGILRDYDIRTFPTCFLIGPDGKLILSPAPAPTENFESRFVSILRAEQGL